MKTITKGLLLTTSLALFTSPFAHKVNALESTHHKESTTTTTVTPHESAQPKDANEINVSKPVKDAIRAVLQNKERFFDLVERYAGKQIRNEIEQAFNKHIEPVLKDLLGYVALSWDTVNSKVTEALKDAGFSTKAAKNLAYFVTLAMKNFN
ncbi:hypothetical protein [Bacillus halotolerans]|uniref:hypothetical protein n=1 Tax=Bacillus halotolerans TaxID=260554 RepID=UPI003D1D7985